MTKRYGGMFILFAVMWSAGAVQAEPSEQHLAWFEGRQIDLAAGWGDARACSVEGDSTMCFRSEAEMDRYHVRKERKIAMPGPITMSTKQTSTSTLCSSSLRLYEGTNYTGAVVSIASRHEWVNLSSRGFNNRTSSYKVGACATRMNDGSDGSGVHFTGNTAAGASVPSMPTGWNNRISSVRLN